MNLVLFEAQGNARSLFAVQKILQGGRYKRILEEVRARNAGVGGGGAAQAGVEGESEAEAHSDIGYETTSIPVRITINGILVNIDINEEVDINLSTSENFVDALEGPAVIEVEYDLGRQDGEINSPKSSGSMAGQADVFGANERALLMAGNISQTSLLETTM